MKQEVKIGQTDYSVFVLIRDTNGAAKTALVYTDIDIAYARMETDNDATTSDVTPATLASLTAAHSDWGFLLVSDTDHPGLYRLDIADAVFATGAWSSVVSITGTGLDPTHIEFVLVPSDPYTGVNVAMWNGAAVATPTVSGVPEVDITYRLGSAASAEATTAEIADAVNRYAHTGTCQAGSASTTIVLASGASSTNDIYNGTLVRLTGGTGSGQRRWITDYVGSSRTATVDAAWITTPDNTTTYEVL